MWRVLVRAVLVTSAVVVAAPGASPAGAAEVRMAGWWTASPLPSPPDTDDRLVVQGSPDPDAPLSYAAVAFDLSPDETATALSLTVAEGSVSTPVTELVACPLLEDFEPASGAPMSDAPAYDCADGVSAQLDGDRYLFVAGTLVDGDRLAVAIVPSLPTDRVVLEVPDDGSLGTLATGVPAGGGVDDLTFTSPGAGSPGPAAPDLGGGGPSAMSPLPSPGVAPPALAPDAAAAPQDAPATAPASEETALGPREELATRMPSLDDDGASPLAVLGFLVLATAATTLWLRAGRVDPDEVDDHAPAPAHGAAA